MRPSPTGVANASIPDRPSFIRRRERERARARERERARASERASERARPPSRLSPRRPAEAAEGDDAADRHEALQGHDQCRGLTAPRAPAVVGRGHVSLLTNSDAWQCKPFRGVWCLLIHYQHSCRGSTARASIPPPTAVHNCT